MLGPTKSIWGESDSEIAEGIPFEILKNNIMIPWMRKVINVILK